MKVTAWKIEANRGTRKCPQNPKTPEGKAAVRNGALKRGVPAGADEGSE